MEKIKAFFKSIAGYLVAGLGLLVAGVVYALIRKQEENEALKAQLSLANTQKEVDIIEVEVKAKAAERVQTEKELLQTQKDLALIEQKRAAIKANMTDQEVEEYWNKK